MITSFLHNSIPLTHIFLYATCFTIINSFLIFYKLIIPLFLCLIFLLSFSYFFNNKNFLLFFIALTSALIVFVRINKIEYQYKQDNIFLQKPVILEALIESINHNLLDQKNSSLILNTYSIFNQETGSLKKTKKIFLLLPYNRAKNLKIGQKIKIYNIKLSQPQDNDPYKKYFLKEQIWATSFIYKENFFTYKKINNFWYQSFFEKFSNYFNTTISQLYNPLFLGKKEKNYNSLKIQHQSLYWGIMHHMARSGIHLVSLLGLLEFLFHYSRFFSRFRFLVYIIFTVLYSLISVPSISFIRSLFMIFFQMFTKLNGFMYSGLHSFLLTTLIIIIYNPMYVFFLDFQLSFGITAIIIWLFFIKRQKNNCFLII